MKTQNTELKAFSRAVAVLLLAGLLAFLLFSCEKNHNWDCNTNLKFINMDSTCAHNPMVINFPEDDKTYAEIHKIESDGTYSKWVIQDMDTFRIDSRTHCLPVYCPEY